MDFTGAAFEFFAVFGIPIVVGLIVYLWFDRMIKKAIIAGLVVLLLILLLGWDATVILGWFT
jgi:hypothetical protein